MDYSVSLPLLGYEIPLVFRNGLPYLPIKPYTDCEYETLPHVIMTSDKDWDACVLDDPADETGPINAGGDVPNIHDNFNQDGEYMDRCVVTMADISDDILEERLLLLYVMFRHKQHVPVPTDTKAPVVQPRLISQVEADFVSLMPFLAYQPVEAIKHAWLNSTQFARNPISTHLTRRFKSPFPVHNVHHRDKPTVYLNTPVVNNGVTYAQFFVGLESMVVTSSQ